jgi:hypothetical protein
MSAVIGVRAAWWVASVGRTAPNPSYANDINEQNDRDFELRRAAAAGVAIQTLSSFAVGENALAGIVLGYGGIPTTDIQEGLRRLGKCFGQWEPGGTTTPL